MQDSGVYLEPETGQSATAVPCAQDAKPKDINNYRPVMITYHLMKSLERVSFSSLPSDEPINGSLKFAYQPGIGVDDVATFLLHRALRHLGALGELCFLIFKVLATLYSLCF